MSSLDSIQTSGDELAFVSEVEYFDMPSSCVGIFTHIHISSRPELFQTKIISQSFRLSRLQYPRLSTVTRNVSNARFQT